MGSVVSSFEGTLKVPAAITFTDAAGEGTQQINRWV